MDILRRHIHRYKPLVILYISNMYEIPNRSTPLGFNLVLERRNQGNEERKEKLKSQVVNLSRSFTMPNPAWSFRWLTRSSIFLHDGHGCKEKAAREFWIPVNARLLNWSTTTTTRIDGPKNPKTKVKSNNINFTKQIRIMTEGFWIKRNTRRRKTLKHNK